MSHCKPVGRSNPSCSSARRVRHPAIALAVTVALFTGGYSFASTLYWDGSTASGYGDGASEGGSGTWSTTVADWDQGAGQPYVAWSTGNDAYFGGVAAMVTLGKPISATGITVATGSYNIATGGSAPLTIGTDGISTTNTTGTTTLSGSGGIILGGNQNWSTAGGTLTLSSTANIADQGYTLTFSGSGTDNLNGVLAGTGGLTTSGTVNLTTTAVNVYTGTTTIGSGTSIKLSASSPATASLGTGPVANGGTLYLSVAGLVFANDISGSGGVTLYNTATLSGALSYTGNTVLGNGSSASSLTFGNAGGQTLAGLFSGAGGIVQSGSGTTILSNTANNYTGTTKVNAGVLEATNAGALPVYSTSAGAFSVAPNATIAAAVGGSGQFSSTDVDALRAKTTFATNALLGLDTTGGAFTYAIASGSGLNTAIGLNKLGMNTLTLGATNAYTGNTVVTGGTLNIGTGAGLASASAIVFNGTGTLDLAARSQTPMTIIAGTTNTPLTGTVTDGSLSLGASSFNFSPANTAGTSTLDLHGLSSFTYNQSMAFAVTAGTAAGSAAVNLPTLAGSTATITASVFNVGTGASTASTTGTATVNLGQSTNINTASLQLAGSSTSGGTIQFAPVASGLPTPTLMLRGTAGGTSPVPVINVDQSNSAATGTVNGILDLSGGSVDGIVTALNVVNNGAASAGSNNGIVAVGAGALNIGTLSLGTANTSGGSTTLDNATFNQSGGTVLASTVQFAAPTVNTNARMIGVYNLGTTGATPTAATLRASNVSVGSTYSTGSGSLQTLNFNDGTIATYNDAGIPGGTATPTLTSLTIGGTAASPLDIVLGSTGTHSFYAESGQQIAEQNTAMISGLGGLTANGPGTVTLSGANTYSGGTTISAGTLSLGNDAGLGATTASLNVSGGTLDIVAHTPVVGAVTLAGGTIQGNGGVLTGSSYALQAGTVSASLGGAGALAKATAGTVTLSASNAYTGGTTIAGGNLVTSGSSPTGTGAVTVGDGANAGSGTLAGTGAISNGTNALTVAFGGTITAGSSATPGGTPGTLTTGVQTWNGGGTFVDKLASAGGGVVTSNDHLVMSGLTLATAAGNPFNVSVIGTTGTALALPATGFIVLADDTASTSNPFHASPATLAAEFTLSAPGLQVPTGYSYQLDSRPDSGNGYELVVDAGTAAAPEPTSLLLLGAATAPLALGRRRR